MKQRFMGVVLATAVSVLVACQTPCEEGCFEIPIPQEGLQSYVVPGPVPLPEIATHDVLIDAPHIIEAQAFVPEINRVYGTAVLDGRIWIYGQPEIADMFSSQTPIQAWVSGDGITWVEVEHPIPPQYRRAFNISVTEIGVLIFGGRVRAPGGIRSDPLTDVWFTEDGVNWNQIADGLEIFSRLAQTMAFWNDDLFHVSVVEDDTGSNNMHVYRSRDGRRWDQVYQAPFSLTSRLIHNESILTASELLLLRESRGGAFATSDGIEWEYIDFTEQIGELSESSFVIAHTWHQDRFIGTSFEFSDDPPQTLPPEVQRTRTWTSVDGRIWEQVPEEQVARRPQYEGRIEFSFQGRRYSVGGREPIDRINPAGQPWRIETWVSEDGITDWQLLARDERPSMR